MSILILGMVIFFSAHLVPTFIGLREKLVSWKGEPVYLICYSLAAALLIHPYLFGVAALP